MQPEISRNPAEIWNPRTCNSLTCVTQLVRTDIVSVLSNKNDI
jgi:hypothetical protein